jgi:echinoid protein
LNGIFKFPISFFFLGDLGVNMAYTEHSYSNSNNGGSVNSQDSLWQLKLASQNGGGGVGVNGGGADHQLGNGTLPDRSYHYDPMTHGGYGGFEDYSHYPPSNGDDYLQRNNYGVVAGGNGDPYAAVHKNGKRMEHLGMNCKFCLLVLYLKKKKDRDVDVFLLFLFL